MAANQLIGALPFVTLDTGCTITVEAIDPTTGATVTGVTVSQVAFRTAGDNLTAQAFDYDSLYTHAPSET